jgi:hypothetical protein
MFTSQFPKRVLKRERNKNRKQEKEIKREKLT